VQGMADPGIQRKQYEPLKYQTKTATAERSRYIIQILFIFINRKLLRKKNCHRE
jgi:hypothetical protein